MEWFVVDRHLKAVAPSVSTYDPFVVGPGVQVLNVLVACWYMEPVNRCSLCNRGVECTSLYSMAGTEDATGVGWVKRPRGSGTSLAVESAFGIVGA